MFHYPDKFAKELRWSLGLFSNNQKSLNNYISLYKLVLFMIF